MNLFEIFDKKEYENSAILFDGEKVYTIADIKKLIAPGYEKLRESNKQNVLITSKNNFDFFINFLSAVFAKKEIFLLSDTKKLNMLDFDYINLDEIPHGSSLEKTSDMVFEKVDTKNAFLTLCTSGSSGKPKLIRKSIENLIIEAEDINKNIAPTIQNKITKIKIATSTTALHMFGLSCWLFLPLCNFERFLISTKEIIYPDRAEIQDSIFVSTPSFLDTYKKYNVELENKPLLIMTAGDKLKDEIYEYFDSYNVPILEIYGSTETGVIGFKTQKNEDFFHCFGSVEIETDNNSQIVIKSPFFDEEKIVLYDIIEMRDKKNFRLVSRNDRIVKIQEKRVSLIEIENVLKESELTENVYCFKHGEKLACAAVLNKEGKDFYLNLHNGGRQNLIKKLKNDLKDKSEIVPQKWRFLHELPKTRTGKTDKEKLNEIFNTNISFPLVLDYKKTENEAEFEIVFSKHSNFFEGHFKDLPILPGVVQLYFAHEFAKESFNKTVLNNPVKKIKFSHLIRPDEKLKLSLKLNNNTVTYQYSKNSEVCSSGIFTTK